MEYNFSLLKRLQKWALERCFLKGILVSADFWVNYKEDIDYES